MGWIYVLGWALNIRYGVACGIMINNIGMHPLHVSNKRAARQK